MSKKKMRRVAKGIVQDALRGTSVPSSAANVFALTGTQSITPATLGQKLVGNLGPTNAVPGVSASLAGGESPLIIGAEVGGGLDLTKAVEKRLAKKVKKAQRKAMKPLRKAQRNPVAALSRLELLARSLPARHPARIQAAAVSMKARLRAEATAAVGGSLAKATDSMDPLEVVSALSEVEQALGIGVSGAAWLPQQLDARQQLTSIMSGHPESLSGTQNADALTAYTSPAAALGQALKQTDGHELVAAERAVKSAEVSGDGLALSQAHERLTVARLVAAHRAEGMS